MSKAHLDTLRLPLEVERSPLANPLRGPSLAVERVEMCKAHPGPLRGPSSVGSGKKRATTSFETDHRSVEP